MLLLARNGLKAINSLDAATPIAIAAAVLASILDLTVCLYSTAKLG